VSNYDKVTSQALQKVWKVFRRLQKTRMGDATWRGILFQTILFQFDS